MFLCKTSYALFYQNLSLLASSKESVVDIDIIAQCKIIQWIKPIKMSFRNPKNLGLQIRNLEN